MKPPQKIANSYMINGLINHWAISIHSSYQSIGQTTPFYEKNKLP
jgi:hypothetical protein